jgi:MYXO-CTERM domain-containing protein
VLLVGGLARAHGPAPAPLDVLTGTSAVPGLVRSSVGLASRLPDGTYEYVCPSRWDGNERALAAARADGQEVLVHSAGVAYHSRDGGCTFAEVTDGAIYVTAAVSWGDGFLVVAEGYPEDSDPDRSLVFRWHEGTLRAWPWEGGVIDGALSIEGGVVVSGARPEPFVAVLEQTGASSRAVPAMPELRRLTPRAEAGGAVWLAARDGDAGRLVQVAIDGAIEDGALHDVAHGPVRLGARWLAVLDGVLHEHPIGPGAWRAVGQVPWTCLGTVGLEPYACSLEGLFALRDDGAMPTAIPSFSMRQLGPPRACGDADQVSACRRDWAHFGGESGWVDTAPARTPTEPRRPLSAGGCAVGGGGSGWLGVALLFIAALRRRRA